MPHVFVGVTVISPLVLPAVTMMLFVPEPEVTVLPDGTVHVYPVAPETVVME